VFVSGAIMTAVNDEGYALLNNMGGRCNFMSETNKTAKTFEMHGFCNYADRTGDQVFEEFMTNGPSKLGIPVIYKGKCWEPPANSSFEWRVRNPSNDSAGLRKLGSSCG
jgi:hypothetical protein